METVKEQIIALWKICFDDPEAFVRLYFDTRYREEQARVSKRDGRVISVLQSLPYTLTCWGGKLPAAYIYGACTHPLYRGQGEMQVLLADAIREMRRNRTAVSVLIPAEERLYDYYRRLGYAPVMRRTVSRCSISRTCRNISCPHDSDRFSFDELFSFFSPRMRERPCCIQHTFPDFQFLVEDIRLAGGQVIAVADETDRLCGLAFALPQNCRVLLKEWLCDSEAARELLLGTVAGIFPGREICAFSPVMVDASSSEVMGMLRIVDAAVCLQRYAAAHPDVSLHYNISDPVVAENNALFVVGQGGCRQLPPDPATEKTDIAALPELLWPSDSGNFEPPPYMSLMMD